MTPKRVVILADESAVRGGQAVLAMLSARLLKARGIEVVFVCGDDGQAPELQALGIEVAAAGSAPLLAQSRGRAVRKGLYDADMRDFVAEAVRRYDAPGAVFHLHGWAQVFSPSVFSALVSVAPRCFIHAHDMFLACPNGVFMDFQAGHPCERRPLSTACITAHCDKRSYGHKLWRVARHAMLKRCFDMSADWAGIVIINHRMQPLLGSFGYPDGLFRVLRNPARPFCSERVPAESNRPFLYVGRLEPDKGVLALAQAAERVGVPLICVGDGSLREVLARDFPAITLPGWLDHAGVAEWAARSRAIVVPSMLPEPFGLVLVEAIHSGLPAAVSQIAMMSGEIEAEGLGLRFDVTKPDSFDAVLRRFRDMPGPELADMSRRGHAGDLRLGPSETEWADGLVALYETALARA